MIAAWAILKTIAGPAIAAAGKHVAIGLAVLAAVAWVHREGVQSERLRLQAVADEATIGELRRQLDVADKVSDEQARMVADQAGELLALETRMKETRDAVTDGGCLFAPGALDRLRELAR